MGTMLGEQQEIEEHKFHAVKITDMFSVEAEAEVDNLGKVIGDKVERAFEEADDFIFEFSGHIETIILPSNIETNFLPEHPFHPLLFKNSRKENLKSYTAPWEYRIDNKLCVFLPEAIFRTIKDYTPLETETEMVEHLIRLSHWAPFCPGILGTSPAQQNDIFVIDTIPDLVWTVGDTRSMKEINIDGHKVLVLVVPKFHLTSEISVLTFDPTKGILCEKVVIDV